MTYIAATSRYIFKKFFKKNTLPFFFSQKKRKMSSEKVSEVTSLVKEIFDIHNVSINALNNLHNTTNNTLNNALSLAK